MSGLWHRLTHPFEDEEAARRAVVSDIDSSIERHVGLARRLDPARRTDLVDGCIEFIGTREWTGADGFEVTSEVATVIAANAILAVLNLDLWLYRRVTDIIVYPSARTGRQTQATAADGVLHEGEMTTIGEAGANSAPIVLAWDAVLADSRHPERGSNVVIHEFAHKIDMVDGAADGLPPIRGTAAETWADLMAQEFDPTASGGLEDILNPYAYTNQAEFFAVISETFFCLPERLRVASPAWWDRLRALYCVDPRHWSRP